MCSGARQRRLRLRAQPQPRRRRRFPLILNPDLELAPDALVEALAFLRAHPECGLVAPAVRWEDGRVQYLCKRVPAVFDLFLRGFAPG